MMSSQNCTHSHTLTIYSAIQQVMAVELFANNTFSTLGGLGSSTILRGKWSIIGEKRDQLWMMVYRFGFGRSVSGSTFR